MGITREIAEFVWKTKFGDFDSEPVKRTKHVMLSGLGMTLAGSRMRAGRIVINYVKECAAPEEAGVIGAGFRTSAEYAALANGTTPHATELEECSQPEGMYSCGTFPAVFALGQKLHISGKQAIEAFIIGWDIAAKLGLAAMSMSRRGFAVAGYFSTIGVAALSAKLLNLNIEETTMAVSLAAMHSSGLLQQTGTHAHLYESGLSGRNGIASAMLAKHGLTGQPNILESPMGLLDAVAGITDPDLKLGGRFRASDIWFKRYPCCFLQQHVVSGFLQLIKEHDIAVEDVESIQLDVHPGVLTAVRYCHPADEHEARFSLPHSIACCFLESKISLDSYSNEKAQDPRFHEFRDKVKIVVHNEWDKPGLLGGEIPIAIRLKDGTEYKKVCPGTTEPIVLTEDEVMEKYMDCALRVLSRNQAEQVAEKVLSLEKEHDISELMNLVTFG